MTPKFKTIEVRPQETLGERLKKIRESLKLTYDEVEKRTKIRKKYIKAIEESDYQELPSNVYSRGFLKNYARLLGLSQEKVLSIYEKERGIAENIKDAKSQKKKVRRKRSRFVITPKTIFAFFIVLASIAVASYIIYEIFILTSPPRLEILTPKQNESVSSNFIDISGKTDPGAEILINGQKVNTSEDGDFKVTVSLGKDGVNSITVMAKNPKNGKSMEITRNIVADIQEVSIPENNEILEQKVLSLNLEIGPKTAWIRVIKDGEKAFDGLMLPGTKKVFSANEYFSVTTGNAGSTKFIFNNKDLGTLGSEGEVLNDLRFDKNTVLN